MSARGFTLIELLIVIAIIALLMAMLFPLSNYLIWQVKAMRTEERMLSLQRNLVLYGDAEIYHRKLLQPALAASGVTATGVSIFRATIGQQNLLFGAGGGGGYLMPEVGTWIDPSLPWAFPHPWGPKTYLQPTASTTAWKGELDQPPLARTLADLSPGLTPRLLIAGGLIEQESEWLENRSPNRSWNDAWGNPLVCAFALFQPPENTTVDYHNVNRKLQDLYVKHAKRVYGYDRAVYLAVAAAGDRLRTPLAGVAATDATALWTQATTTCEAEQWNGEAWNQQPAGWNRAIKRGRRQVAGQLERSFITIPVEIR
jgi:prepilin-type N-terminal cleavage/methylation domain-containing protein